MKLPPLPELPEPDGSAAVVVGTVPSGPMMADVEKYVDAWSREKVEAYALAYGRAVQEACAEIAESFATCPCNGERGRCMENDPPRAVAAAIRNGGGE